MELQICEFHRSLRFNPFGWLTAFRKIALSNPAARGPPPPLKARPPGIACIPKDAIQSLAERLGFLRKGAGSSRERRDDASSRCPTGLRLDKSGTDGSPIPNRGRARIYPSLWWRRFEANLQNLRSPGSRAGLFSMIGEIVRPGS